MSQKPEAPFLWIPGEGPDAAALARLRKNFPRPREPMGEAWFMGAERHRYTNLRDVDDMPASELERPLVEITTGMSSFGPMREWSEWFHHLIAPLAPRAHEGGLRYPLEYLLGACFTMYPDGLERGPYRGFRADALATLGRSMMDDLCWKNGRVNLDWCLHRPDWSHRDWPGTWRDASPDFSISMFFCLKYLTPDEIAAWLPSVLAIECPHWRAQVIVWFIGARAMLSGERRQASELSTHDSPRVDWEWSHLLRGNYTGVNPGQDGETDFLPVENRRAALRALHGAFTESLFLEWLESIAAVHYLDEDLDDCPFLFHELYLSAVPDAV